MRVSRLAQEYQQRKAASEEEGASLAKTIDYFNYFLSLQAFHEFLGEGNQKSPLLKEGLRFGVLYLQDARDSFTRYFNVLGSDDATIRNALVIFNRGAGSEGVWNFAEAVRSVSRRIKIVSSLGSQIADGEDLKRLRQIALFADTESPATRLNLASKVIHKALRKAKSWISQAAEEAGAAPTKDETIAVVAEEARGVARQLVETEAQLGGVDPDSQRAADLKLQRASLADTIRSMAEESTNPEVVKAVAIAEQTKQTTHATEIGRKLGMTPEQEAALLASGKAIIAAGAGSGKTRVLAGMVVDLISRQGVRSDRIIATSFSKKSAAELKKRVLSYGGDSILSGGDEGFGTTHSVSLKLLTQFSPNIANAKIMDSDTYLVKMAMAQVMMYPVRKTPDPKVVGMFDGLYQPDLPSEPPKDTNWEPEAATQALSPMQSRAKEVLHTAIRGRWGLEGLADWAIGNRYTWGNALQQLCHYILSGNRGPSDIEEKVWPEFLRVINTQSTKNSIERNKTLKMNSSEFIQMMMDARSEGLKKTANDTRGDKSSRFWKEPANQWFNLGVKRMVDAQSRAVGAKRFSTAISNFRANLVTPSEAWAKDPTVFAAVYGAYDWLKKNDPINSGMIDFDDMLVEACKLLIANPKARAIVQAKFTHVLVDEAQDLNKAQHLLFGLITGYYDPETRLPRKDGKMTAKSFIFMGDDKQAIYEFRGAIPDLFIERSDAYSSEDGKKGDFKTHFLKTNFRSGKKIVDAANALIAHNTKQIPMDCDANVDRKGQGLIHNVVVSTHEEGAAYAAEQIRQMVEGENAIASPKDFGIAVRTNAESYAYGVELLKRGIAFRSKISFFNDETTKALVMWLQLVGAATTDIKTINEIVLNAHRVPRFNLNMEFQTQIQRAARGQNYLEFLARGGWDDIYTGDNEWRNRKYVEPYTRALLKVRSMKGKPEDILNEILTLEGAEIGGVQTNIIDSLIERVKGSPESMDLLAEESEDGAISEDSIKGLALAPIKPLIGLLSGYEDLIPALAYVEKLQRANDKKAKKDNPEAEDYNEPAVVIDTCHGWKGLETKNVFIPMAAGVFPHKASEKDEAQMASERRLAYVAITRGENTVTIINPMETHMGQVGGVSRFVEEACIKPLGGESEEPEGSSKQAGDWVKELSLAIDQMEMEDMGYQGEPWGSLEDSLESKWDFQPSPLEAKQASQPDPLETKWAFSSGTQMGDIHGW